MVSVDIISQDIVLHTNLACALITIVMKMALSLFLLYRWETETLAIYQSVQSGLSGSYRLEFRCVLLTLNWQMNLSVQQVFCL